MTSPTGRVQVTGVQRDDDAELGTWRIAAIAPERSYIIEGHTWVVCEVIDPSSGMPVLVFTSDRIGRRVHRYPANWRDLPGEQLHAVSWSK